MLFRSHLGCQEGQLQCLLAIEARIARRLVPRMQVAIAQPLSAAGALCDIVPGQFNMHATRVSAQVVVHLEEPAQLVHDVVKTTRLLTTSGLGGVAMHRIADPHHLAARGLEVNHAGLRVALRVAPAAARFFAEPSAERTVARAERLAPGTRAALPEGATATVTDEAPVLVLLRSPSVQGARVGIATPCVRFEGSVESRAVLPVLEMEFGDPSPAQPPRWIIRAGARLHWPNRGPAGSTVSTVVLASEGRADGDARCFQVPLRVQGATVGTLPTVEVCAAAADLRGAGSDP